MSCLWSILVCKIPQFFGQKLPIWEAHHTFLESRHTEVTKNLYYILSTYHSQILIFQAPANGLNIVVQKRTLKHSNPHSNFICCLMFSIIYIIHISEKSKDLVYYQIFIIISNLITTFRTVGGIYTVMTFQKVAQKTAML